MKAILMVVAISATLLLSLGGSVTAQPACAACTEYEPETWDCFYGVEPGLTDCMVLPDGSCWEFGPTCEPSPSPEAVVTAITGTALQVPTRSIYEGTERTVHTTCAGLLVSVELTSEAEREERSSTQILLL